MNCATLGLHTAWESRILVCGWGDRRTGYVCRDGCPAACSVREVDDISIRAWSAKGSRT